MKTIRCYQCDKYSSADLQDCSHCGAELVRYESAPLAGAGFAPMEQPTPPTRGGGWVRSYLPARATWSFIALGLVCWVTSYFGSVVDGQLMPQALMSSFAFALVFVGGIAIYLLPTLLAMSRNRRQAMAIGVLNVFLGWTFLGWVVALVWACMEDRTEKGC